VKSHAQTWDRAAPTLDWLAAQIDSVRVVNVGLLGLPHEYAVLGPRVRSVSCDPLASTGPVAGATVAPVAVSAYGGTEELRVTRDSARSSLLEPNWAVVSRHGESAGFEVVDRRAVASVTLPELAAEHGPTDVLRLDCQGLEYQLISSALETVTGAVCIEVRGGLVDNYVGQYPLAAVTTLLHGAGYAMVELECAARPRVGWDTAGRHQPVEYRGLWLRDQVPETDALDFGASVKLLALCRTLGHLSFGQQLATAMYGQSLLPPDVAGTLCAAAFWRGRWDLPAPDAA
jgi:FkbM family methyltransferase